MPGHISYLNNRSVEGIKWKCIYIYRKWSRTAMILNAVTVHGSHLFLSMMIILVIFPSYLFILVVVKITFDRDQHTCMNSMISVKNSVLKNKTAIIWNAHWWLLISWYPFQLLYFQCILVHSTSQIRLNIWKCATKKSWVFAYNTFLGSARKTLHSPLYMENNVTSASNHILDSRCHRYIFMVSLRGALYHYNCSSVTEHRPASN